MWMKIDTLHLSNVCKVADVVEKISLSLSVLCLTNTGAFDLIFSPSLIYLPEFVSVFFLGVY